MNKKLLLIGLLLLSFPLVGASQSLYADITIDVTPRGVVSVKGITNSEGLLVENNHSLTSKNNGLWLLNISKDEVFDSLLFRIQLPQGASVSYMKLPEFSRIETSPQGMTIIGTASHKQLRILVQYELSSSSKQNDALIWLIVIISGLLIIGGFAWWFMRKKPFAPIDELPPLPPRQEKICVLLQQNGGSLHQHEIEEKTGFPKSAVSRNIASLEQKNIIEKHAVGMSNIIKLHKGKD